MLIGFYNRVFLNSAVFLQCFVHDAILWYCMFLVFVTGFSITACQAYISSAMKSIIADLYGLVPVSLQPPTLRE